MYRAPPKIVHLKRAGGSIYPLLSNSPKGLGLPHLPSISRLRLSVGRVAGFHNIKEGPGWHFTWEAIQASLLQAAHCSCSWYQTWTQEGGTREWAATWQYQHAFYSNILVHPVVISCLCLCVSLESPFSDSDSWNDIHPSQFGLWGHLLLENTSDLQIKNNHFFWTHHSMFFTLYYWISFSPSWCSRSVTTVHFMGHNLMQICKSFPLFSWVNNMRYHKFQFYHF